MHRFFRAPSKSGQVLPLIACLMIGMIAVIGLVVDSGMIEASRRHAQRAADSAAQAGAREMLTYYDSASQAAARSNALVYAGYNGMATNLLSIELPPSTSQYYNGSNRFIRVYTRKPTNTTFLRLLATQKSVSVTASATAGVLYKPAPFTLLTLAKHGTTLTVSGGGVLNVGGGTVIVDSDDPYSAATLNGSGQIKAAAVNIHGGMSSSDAQNVIPRTALSVGTAILDDPFRSVMMPQFTNTSGYTSRTGTSIAYSSVWKTSYSCDSANTPAKPGNTSLSGEVYPGVFWGGISVGKNATVHFNPGIYVLAGGGMTLNANVTAMGSDVVFYNTNDPWATTGGGNGSYGNINFASGTFAFQAPGTGDYKGFLFIDDRNSANTASISFSGQLSMPTGYAGAAPLIGYIYAPNNALSLSGGAGSSGLGAVVSTFSDSGSGTLGVVDQTRVPAQPVVKLVE